LFQQQASSLPFRKQQFLAAPLLGADIDLAPELVEVRNGGPDRKQDHDVKREVRPLYDPRVMHADHQQRNRQNLPECFRLPEFARPDGVALDRSYAAQARHGELSANQKHNQPPRNRSYLYEGDQRRRNQELVGDRIQQRSDGGYLPPAAGQITIQQVRCGSHPKNNQRNHIICDDSAVPMEYDSFLYQHCDEYWDKEYSSDGEGIRKIHQFPPTVEITVNLI